VNNKVSMLYQYNQRSLAERILGYGFQGAGVLAELKILGLYLYLCCGMKPAGVRTFLHEFCKKYRDDYHFRRYAVSIDRAVRNLDRNKILPEVSEIAVTQEQLNYIATMDVGDQCKKVAFTIMVIKELDAEFYAQCNNGQRPRTCTMSIADTKIRQIKRASGIAPSADLCEGALWELMDKGYVHMGETRMVLNYISAIPAGGAPVMRITQYTDIGLYWELHMGNKGVTVCEECGVPIRKTSNRARHCERHRVRSIEAVTKAPAVVKLACATCGHDFYVPALSASKRRCPSCERA